jgi:hypothetical protein
MFENKSLLMSISVFPIASTAMLGRPVKLGYLSVSPLLLMNCSTRLTLYELIVKGVPSGSSSY